MPVGPLPARYQTMPPQELAHRVARRKLELGRELCILGHHYQSDDVIQFADLIGDSLKLSQLAAAQTARFIVFCGVHFMAESADILTSDRQAVILPNLRAGCSMAEMVDATDLETALAELSRLSGGRRIVPVTYVNSTAAVKAVTGRAGGACCTSSNVRNVFEWAFRPAQQGGGGAEIILAPPDQHLAMNTAEAMGFGPDDWAVYQPELPEGGLTAEQAKRVRFVLFGGFCYVHVRFKPRDVEQVRRQHPLIRVIVHPECPREVVRLADQSGSTEQIIRAVEGSPARSQWAIGTEANLVNRLARRLGDRFIRNLSDAPSTCWQMASVDLPHLLWVLDGLAQGQVVNQVKVAPQLARQARLALERMVAIQPVKQATDISG